MSAFRQTRILVAEDHPLVREGIVALIRQQPDFLCCAEADSIFETVTYAATKKPDLILLDLRLQDGDALDLIRLLRSKFPATLILVLSQGDEKVYAGLAIRNGAHGYLMKQDAPMELAKAIRTVMAGKIFLSLDMASVPEVRTSKASSEKTA